MTSVRGTLASEINRRNQQVGHAVLHPTRNKICVFERLYRAQSLLNAGLDNEHVRRWSGSLRKQCCDNVTVVVVVAVYAVSERQLAVGCSLSSSSSRPQ